MVLAVRNEGAGHATASFIRHGNLLSLIHFTLCRTTENSASVLPLPSLSF